MTSTIITVGLDIGTTVAKALARSADGRSLCTVQESSTWHTDASGRTQTDAPGFVSMSVRLLRKLVIEAEKIVGPVSVAGVGITGLAESGVLLGDSGTPIAPVIAWFDKRGEAETAAISANEPEFESAFRTATGLPWDCQASAAKLLSLIASDGPIRPGSRWLSVQEWVAYSLGADQVREPSLASRTGLIDQDTGGLWEPMADILALPDGFLPPAALAGTAAGRLTHPDLPAQYRGAVVTVAGHDHPVAAVGAGAIGRDSVFNSSGTADVVLRTLPGRVDATTRTALVDAGWSVGAHVLPDTAMVIGGARGGLFLRRILGMLGADDPAVRDAVDAAACSVTTLPKGLVLSGTGPTGDDVQISLRDDATPGTVWAAATRVAAENLKTLLTSLSPLVGEHHDAVSAGGWTRMASVRLAKQQAIPRIRFSANSQPGLTGAALFAEQAAGLREHLGDAAAEPAAEPTTGAVADPALAPPQPVHG